VIDLLVALARMSLRAPLMTLGVMWWAFTAHAKRARMPWAWLGPIAVATWLYKNRRDLRGVVVWTAGTALVVVWVGLLWSSPSLRFAVGLALPSGLAAAGLMWLADRYPELPPGLAVRVALAERRHREVLSDAVPASAGDGARLIPDSVRRISENTYEADIVGPPGKSHADLLDHLRSTLAETIYALSGKRMAHIAVVSNGARGAVRVRCSTEDPYSKTMRLADMR
jgi:hypothetical protein